MRGDPREGSFRDNRPGLERPGWIPNPGAHVRGGVHGGYAPHGRRQAGRADPRERVHRQDCPIHSDDHRPRVRVRIQRQRLL